LKRKEKKKLAYLCEEKLKLILIFEHSSLSFHHPSNCTRVDNFYRHRHCDFLLLFIFLLSCRYLSINSLFVDLRRYFFFWFFFLFLFFWFGKRETDAVEFKKKRNINKSHWVENKIIVCCVLSAIAVKRIVKFSSLYKMSDDI
jgi:hypothetical protein